MSLNRSRKSSRQSKGWICGFFIGALAFALTPSFLSFDQSSAQGQKNPRAIKPILRRITETQYRRTIADVFGAGVKINARFEPEKREEGLLALGNSELSLTSSGFEQYFALANSIAEQTLDEKNRAALVPCQPANPKQSDSRCARQFIQKYGERLFRRPLTAGVSFPRRNSGTHRWAIPLGCLHQSRAPVVSLLGCRAG
jgi:hypothetical protein